MVDNQTRHLSELVEILKPHFLSVIRGAEFSPSAPDNFDVVIISGSSQFSLLKHRHLYETQIRFLRETSKPVLGICLGGELVALSFEGRIEKLALKAQGLKKIDLVKEDLVFAGVTDFHFYESHRWAITSLSDPLIGLARSTTGYEVIRHRSRLIYGFQFHPEVLPETTGGGRVLSNFLERASESLSEKGSFDSIN